MAANLSRKVKTPSGSQDEWTVRERLILGSSVVRSGDQNWVSVSRIVKPIADSAFGIRPRPSEFFSQKSCAAQYAEMLEKVATPKRKRTNESGGTETPGEQIVRALTYERIDELRKQIKSDQIRYKRLKAEIEAILSGKCDDRLPGILESLQNRSKPPPATEPPVFNPPMQSQPLSQSVPPSPATTPQQTSPQKQKNLRIPKPTERFQKYQQQQQARHSHAATTTTTTQQQQLQQQQLKQLQQHAADTVPMQVDKTSEPSPKELPRQFFRADSQSDGLRQQQHKPSPQQALQKAPHPQKTPITDSSQSVLAQLVAKNSGSADPGAPAVASGEKAAVVNADGAMDVDVTYEKQPTASVANAKSNLDSSKVLGNILEQGNLSHGPAPLSSSGLLPKLLTTPVKEIKHVAETISQNTVVDHDQNESRSQDVSPETVVPFLDGGNVATDVLPKVESVREKKTPIVPASESAPTLSKLLATTAIGSDNKGISPGQTGSFEQKNDGSVSNEEKIQVTNEVSPTSKVTPVPKNDETVQPSEEVVIKDLSDRDRSPQVTKASPLVDETVATSNKAKPEKRRPGRPRTRKLPKEMEAIVDDEIEENTTKEVVKPDLHLKIEPVDQTRASCAVGGKERFKKVVEDLEDFRKEDKFEQSNQSSYGSESVPDSPASQISQSGSDDMDSVQAQKNWKKSIMLVWRAAANHKYANVFLHPVTDDEAPGYHNVIYRPMDLSTVKKNIENGATRNTSEFQRDMMLMFQNALMYNSSDHDVYRMAEEMREDVMEQIQSYIATQLMVQSDRESKMLRGHKTDVFHFSL